MESTTNAEETPLLTAEVAEVIVPKRPTMEARYIVVSHRPLHGWRVEPRIFLLQEAQRRACAVSRTGRQWVAIYSLPEVQP